MASRGRHPFCHQYALACHSRALKSTGNPKKATPEGPPTFFPALLTALVLGSSGRSNQPRRAEDRFVRVTPQPGRKPTHQHRNQPHPGHTPWFRAAPNTPDQHVYPY